MHAVAFGLAAVAAVAASVGSAALTVSSVGAPERRIPGVTFVDGSTWTPR
jgi:hypothetical protein